MVQDPFAWWKQNSKLEFEQGDVRIYQIEDDSYLFVQQIMYASTTERPWYIKHVFPYAKGRCLEVGLGLGVASKVILANNQVNHLLTVESNEDVISAFGRPLVRHNILTADIYKWTTGLNIIEPMYDFIFVDHYTFEEEEFQDLKELATNLTPLLKENGRMIFWIDENAPEEDQGLIKSLWI